MLKENNKAFKYFNYLNPIEHSKNEESANKYKVEPYVVAADIYGSENLLGRGGWTWYTGSASWFYLAGIEYILGLKIENGELSLNACVPEEWEEYSIQYKYKNSIYNIKVKNIYKSNRIRQLILNNEVVINNKIKLKDNNSINNIEIII